MFPVIIINGSECKLLGFDDIKNEFLLASNMKYWWIKKKAFFKQHPDMEFSIPIRAVGFEEDEETRRIIKK